jgi:hypothetical protein
MDLFENEKGALRFPVFFATIDCEGPTPARRSLMSAAISGEGRRRYRRQQGNWSGCGQSFWLCFYWDTSALLIGGSYPWWSAIYHARSRSAA